jgi:hypothetical protein
MDGTVKCWGRNSFGELGDGTTTDRPAPTKVPSLASVTSILAGQFSTCAVTGGQMRCWGDNAAGVLGDGTDVAKPSPTIVKDSGGAGALAGVLSASNGGLHVCAVLSSGGGVCWGSNASGQLGDGTYFSKQVPTAVADVVSFAAVDAGGDHSCGTTSAGTAYCWGANSKGQLGDGTTIDRTTPHAVKW